jgi:thioesterase domain-containing protein
VGSPVSRALGRARPRPAWLAWAMVGNPLDPAVVEAYLHEHIPISAAMGITVASATPVEVALAAPLEPNVNHRSTVFGGSCASVAILAAWTLAHLRVAATGPSRVVIQHGTTDYLRPIRGEFTATCRVDDERAWERFLRTLERFGRARIELDATVRSGGEVVAEFRGTYVALAGPGEEAWPAMIEP